ncbi:hypothetical protein BC832DRAFT_545413 [Gaertneriomyces semiglobifer]|nr:hypothetical protein BC832DRAFT_545413 [Gaertneriomyces semiglobifer]
MPSSHSQFVGYFAVWVMVYGAYRLTFRHKLYKPVLSLLALASALLVGYSRIHLNYHTPHQVMVGLLCGAAYAIVWFLFTEYVVRPNVNLDSKLARMLLLRDYRCVENVVRWEYERVRALSPSGQMKTQKKGKRL